MEFCLESAETAFKSSLRREFLPQSTQQALFDDLLCHNSSNIAADDFSVDCFFDFSNGDENKQILLEVDEDEEDEEEEKDSLSVSSLDRIDDDNRSNFSTVSDSFLASELAVPDDDLADLEWVSQFVDDSLSQFPSLYPSKPEKQFNSVPQPVTVTLRVFPAKIPAKARSKRPRQTGRTWLVADSSSSFSSSSSSSISPPENFKPPLKKPNRKPAAQTAGAGLFQRRCSHCQVQKTPQWRAGPLGAKTLCNACGVRYKSGRLFPEYRPACSPTFSGEVHSNSHRKVIEIRRKKEMESPESGLNRVVPGV